MGAFTLANRQVLVRYKNFGERTGLKVSELALGTGMFGQTWGYGATPEEARRIIEGFADAGGNFTDTADNHQYGVSETTTGDVIRVRAPAHRPSGKYARLLIRAGSRGHLN
jgi:aryl-alcohol dehydrogenase-like predicted oxidoreductase